MERRKFIRDLSSCGISLTVVPGIAVSGLGHTPPSDKLNIAGIGIGGKGSVNLRNMVEQNIVALCDCDFDYANRVFDTYPKAKKYKDYRVMLEKRKDIDAVVIATPDHTHALQAAAAMELGKHVYVQKPLTHTVWESRYLTQLAKRTGVVTQMGNEGHSNDTVYAKKAFKPIPGAKANGRRANNAITNVPANAARAVAVNSAFLSIPAALKISGFTARIYAIVMKVVIPASISVLTVVLFPFRLKNLLTILRNILKSSFDPCSRHHM